MPTTNAYGRVGSFDETRDELLERTPLPSGAIADQSESMLKQLACHLLYAIPGRTGIPTWELEAEHANIPGEKVLDPTHECNWGFDGDRMPTIAPMNGDPDDSSPMVHAGPDATGNEGSQAWPDGAASDDGGRLEAEWSSTAGEDVDVGNPPARSRTS
ncbi:hypothetical protein [Streptomyces sp. NPDC102490]|uniref:hypothetical protein n=1 Tax=Streptomyces sp. NPDC102490 TaxID=3366183 RepID=UPI00382F2454